MEAIANPKLVKHKSTTRQNRARRIMGKNYLGVEEAIRHFSLTPTETELIALADIPFSEATLEECRDTHILAAVFPLSIIDIRGKVESKLFYSSKCPWYQVEWFANDRGESKWHLFPNILSPRSFNKILGGQQSPLNRDEKTPTARVATYIIIGYYLMTGERLFKSTYIQCSDVDSNGDRIAVGVFDSFGLNITFCLDY